MARENKRNRDERRFGKPERFHDILLSSDWMPPIWYKIDMLQSYDATVSSIAYYKRKLLNCVSIEASNVCSYWQEKEIDKRGEGWHIQRDIPSFAIPFPLSFVECTTSNPDHPSRGQWGVLFENWPELTEIKDQCQPETCTLTLATLFLDWGGNGKPYAPVALASIYTDKHGSIIECRTDLFAPINCRQNTKFPEDETHKKFKRWIFPYFVPCMLAVSFMNCKNVTTTAIEPDAKLNRERTKAGLKPFLRYHTINIDPMKRVLKIEGNIETEGLKRALHICRGHFATYSPEKPLFGHFAGTVWKPAHVRGTPDEGIVVSDYKIK
jgi:hypothetical protein